ncbi:MAG: HEAT repeat domain-containing protein [Acidobacteria bacterium]|nr:MAG: HEAT repeat domain-containing protein [Acidobacteriota bacterium]MCE7956537.1 HEAT repeat domain-containing protein [Acidobacteria bacterium ACB2]
MRASSNIHEELRMRLSSLPAPLRSKAARDLARLKREVSSTDDLLRLASSPQLLPEERARAVWALGVLRERKAQPVLFALLTKPMKAEVLAWETVKALAQLRPRGAAAALEEGLGHRSQLTRKVSAWALGQLGLKRARVPLEIRLRDRREAPDVRAQAAEALGSIGARQAAEALIEALEDRDAGVRFWSAYALGEIGDARALAPLQKLISDKSPGSGQHSVGLEARRAIARIRGKTKARS